MKNRRTPTKITLDAYAASHRAVREMKENGELPRRVKVRFALSAAEDVEAKIVAAHDPVLAFNNERDALITAQTLRSLRDPLPGWRSRPASPRIGKSGGTRLNVLPA